MGRLKSCGIEAGQRQVVGDPPGNGSVLIRRHRARQRDDDAQAHLLRGVAVRGVQCVGIDERHVQVVQQARVGIVGVQAHGAPVHHRGVVALAVLQVARDETADVLAAVLVILAHGSVFRHRLPGARGRGELVQQLAPQDLPILPALGHAALAHSHQQLLIVFDLQNHVLLSGKEG